MSEPKSPTRPRLRGCWNALKKLSYGVYVVSARRGDDQNFECNAMTMRFISQVSSRPPRVALSVSKSCLTHDFILESGAFAVSILRENQELLGGHFGLRSGREADKLLQVEYSLGEQTGAPILNECCAWFECRVEAIHDMGACSLIIGEVLAGDANGSPALIYRHSDYFG